MIQFVIPAVTGFVGKMMGKSGADAEADERIEHIKVLANLTPTQAAAIDAVKKAPIEEVRARVELGIGPYATLPANAAAQAQAHRQARIDAATAAVTLTQKEQAHIAAAPDPTAALNAIADQKAAQIVSTVR